MSYQQPRSTKRESRTLVGRFRSGKLAPVMAVKVGGSEGGMLSQEITVELDPIAGRMITPITCDLFAVFVPVQAIDALHDPEADYAGMTEVLREKLLSGTPLWGWDSETEISKRLGVNPRSIGGVKYLCRSPRIAYNCAVNFLRRRKYAYAAQVEWFNGAVTPALLGSTILQRMNAVLDPDDRINGAVSLQLPTMNLPVDGIYAMGNVAVQASGITMRSSDPAVFPDDTSTTTAGGLFSSTVSGAAGQGLAVRVEGATPDVRRPQVFARLNAVTAGDVSLTDFYNAETQDRLVREMRQIVDDNPQYGEEMVLRWAHGLNVDPGKTPVLLAHREQVFGRRIVAATDEAGIAADAMRSDMVVRMGFSVPVAKTELGGVIVTLVSVRPDETIRDQPHPEFSVQWAQDNFVADETALDPEPVTVRDMDADATVGNEATVLFYTGRNQLRATYISYGLNRQVDPETVENKTAIWQYEVPLSVTPENILYPETLDQYPFAVGADEIASYTVTSQKVFQSPMIVGPTPVEELAVITDENLFEE
jgi:hypothetical protein